MCCTVKSDCFFPEYSLSWIPSVPNHNNALHDNVIGNGLIFLNEKDSKHTANELKSYLDINTQNERPSVTDCFHQSIDFNNTKALWDHLAREEKSAKIQRRALNVLQKAWRTIP